MSVNTEFTLTSREVRTKFKTLGLTISKTDYDEWRVNFMGGKEATAYYTDDLEDAYLTGCRMARANQVKDIVAIKGNTREV